MSGVHSFSHVDGGTPSRVHILQKHSFIQLFPSGTTFAVQLAQPNQSISISLLPLFLLSQGSENSMTDVLQYRCTPVQMYSVRISLRHFIPQLVPLRHWRDSPLAAVAVSMFPPRSCPDSSLFLAPSDSLLVPLPHGCVFAYLLRQSVEGEQS